jgi:glycosyltransferase involved in cell wall biosynthesis
LAAELESQKKAKEKIEMGRIQRKKNPPPNVKAVTKGNPPHGDENMYRKLAKIKNGRNGRIFKDPSPPLKTIENVNTRINICIPLWNRAHHVTPLLENIQDIITKTNEKNVRVWIADFHSTDIKLEEHIKKYKMEIKIVLLDPPFIIAKGLQIAAETLPKGEIVYFIDADAHLPQVIFSRLRQFVIKGKQFYCPIVGLQQANKSVWLPAGKKDHGGKGHIGVFVDDFLLCNGWRDKIHLTATPVPGPGPMERVKWGGHDGHLYNKLRWDQLNVYRPKEKDQWVKFHGRSEGWYLNKGKANRRKRR